MPGKSKKKAPPKSAAAKEEQKQVRSHLPERLHKRRRFQEYRMTQSVLYSLLGDVCLALGIAPGETRHSAKARKAVRNVGGLVLRRTAALRADRSWLLVKIGPRENRDRILNLDGVAIGAQSMGAMLTGILEGIRLSARGMIQPKGE